MKPGLQHQNQKCGLSPGQPCLRTPAHLIMIISVFFLPRQRRAPYETNIGIQQLPH